jgi:hypothetical protein
MTASNSHTFADFLNTSECRESCDPKLHARLVGVGDGITTLNALVRWARERYPDHADRQAVLAGGDAAALGQLSQLVGRRRGISQTRPRVRGSNAAGLAHLTKEGRPLPAEPAT